MIPPGTDLKYRLSVKLENFSLEKNDFSLSVVNRWGQEAFFFKKGDFLTDQRGGLYFVMPQVESGVYYAVLTCHVADSDFPDGTQSFVDMRHIVDVGMCGCETCNACCDCTETEGLDVTYERVYDINTALQQSWVFGNSFPVIFSALQNRWSFGNALPIILQ